MESFYTEKGVHPIGPYVRPGPRTSLLDLEDHADNSLVPSHKGQRLCFLSWPGPNKP